MKRLDYDLTDVWRLNTEHNQRTLASITGVCTSHQLKLCHYVACMQPV